VLVEKSSIILPNVGILYLYKAWQTVRRPKCSSPYTVLCKSSYEKSQPWQKYSTRSHAVARIADRILRHSRLVFSDCS